MTLMLTSSAFTHGGAIPKKHTCDGDDRSPPLAWSGVPEGARSLMLLCDDPDAPGGVFHHWAVFNIPIETSGLPEGFAADRRSGGLREAVNDFGRPGYGGPCPPRGDKPHRYRFRLSALDAMLDLSSGASCAEATKRAELHVIASAELTGVFGRQR